MIESQAESEVEKTHPVINVEESIGKTVGRRRQPARPSRIQEAGRAIYRSQGFGVCPRGVYRFESHEEANAWMMQMTMKRAQKQAETT